MQGIAGYSGDIEVAVKTLNSRKQEDIQKFLQEAELMKKFYHPNIVSILGNIVSILGTIVSILGNWSSMY